MVWGSKMRVSEFRVQNWLRVSGSGFQGSRVQGLGFGVCSVNSRHDRVYGLVVGVSEFKREAERVEELVLHRVPLS